MRVVISFILTTTFLFCGYSHNIHRPNNDHVLAGSAAKITFYQQDDQRQQQSSSSSSGSSSSSSLSSSSAGSSSSTPNRMVQSQPSSSATGQRLTRVGGFDEVFRWRQISFTPLENGMCAQIKLRILLPIINRSIESKRKTKIAQQQHKNMDQLTRKQFFRYNYF